MAAAELRHMTLNAEGHGADDNGSSIIYSSDGQVTRNDRLGGDLVTLVLEDPIHGAGKITYVDPNAFKTKQVFHFVATRADNGAVNKLFLQLIDSSGVTVVYDGVAVRQQEK